MLLKIFLFFYSIYFIKIVDARIKWYIYVVYYYAVYCDLNENGWDAEQLRQRFSTFY